MMPLALFGSSTFVGLTLLTLLLYGALGALTVLVPYLLIKAHGYTGTQAGSALVPFAIILTIASPLMGRLAARIGPRLPLTIGPLVVAAGFLVVAARRRTSELLVRSFSRHRRDGGGNGRRRRAADDGGTLIGR